MRALTQQIKFDLQREVFRNWPFLFFSLLMPAGFYVVFTKVMMSGTKQELHQFAGSYMGSMTVYSLMISAFFGLAMLLQRDRLSGYLARLKQTPAGIVPYYASLAFCFMVMTLLSIGIMAGLAAAVNQVTLHVQQVVVMMGIALLGELPLFGVSLLISQVDRTETLSVISNLLTFPLAIVSGLWWPITLLPKWVQTIGQALPTYRLNHLLAAVIANHKTMRYDWVIIMGWLLLVVVAVGWRELRLERWPLSAKK